MEEGRKLSISPTTASLIGAVLAFAGVLIASVFGQWSAAAVEDRRAKTEIVLEIMRTNDREETLEKLRILSASGLLGADDEQLIAAVSQAPATAFKLQEVKIPIGVQCIDPDIIPPELEPLGKLPDDLRRATALLAARALEYKAQNELFRALLIACTDGLPSAEDVETESNQKISEG